jgi:hypothetical protein
MLSEIQSGQVLSVKPKSTDGQVPERMYIVLEDPILSPFSLLSQISDWKAFLQGEEKEEDLKQLRKNQSTGRPLGDESFVERLEWFTGRVLKKNRPAAPKGINRGTNGGHNTNFLIFLSVFVDQNILLLN